MTPKGSSHGHGTGAGKSEAGRFSRMLAVETVPEVGLDMSVCASEAERIGLAAELDLVTVQSFKADFHVRKQAQGRLKVSGVLQALVTQTCVLTLEPFDAVIRADIDVDFAPYGESLGEAAQRTTAAGTGAAASWDEDPPDPIINGQIDLGALAAEFLVLNLDPYPRKPGAVFEEMTAGDKTPEKESPFAVLRRRS